MTVSAVGDVRPDAKVGTTQGRVLLALRYERSTPDTVAKRLRLPVLDVVRALLALEREGEVVRVGRQRGKVVFRAEQFPPA